MFLDYFIFALLIVSALLPMLAGAAVHDMKTKYSGRKRKTVSCRDIAA